MIPIGVLVDELYTRFGLMSTCGDFGPNRERVKLLRSLKFKKTRHICDKRCPMPDSQLELSSVIPK